MNQSLFIFFGVAGILVLLAAAIIVLNQVYQIYIRRVPFSEFGIAGVEMILSLEPNGIRDEIWERGWMTRKQWKDILDRQRSAIHAELARREAQEHEESLKQNLSSEA